MDKVKIQDFFEKSYVTFDKYEVINHDFHVKKDIVSVWANRISGCEHWTVTIELHQCVSEKTDTWQMDVRTLAYQTDEELIAFVRDFEKIHYNEYFPIYLECEADQCAYNNNGICKYASVFGVAPTFDDDDENGCSGYCHNFA